MITILFDENLSFRYAYAFNGLDIGSCRVLSIQKLMQGAKDEEIIEYAESLNETCIICSSDRDFMHRRLYPLARKSKNVGLFIIKFGSHTGYYNQFRFLTKHWQEIRNLSLQEKPPFAYSVNFRGISKL